MLATYASAAIIVGGSLVVGRALMRALGRPETSWLEPVVGFAAILVVASAAVRLFDDGFAGAIVVGAVIAASLAYLRLRVLPWDELRLGAAPALVAAAGASLPLLASLRVGIMGVGINNDLGSHLLWSEWLREQAPDPEPISLAVHGYPVGPHSLAASLGEAFGFEMSEVIVGLLLAVAALTALTALALLRGLPPGRRVLACGLVALPYMTASALAIGGFKETTMGLLLLGFVMALATLEREWPGDRALLASLGVLAAGALAAYSYPGLYWLLAAAGLLAFVGLVRALREGRLSAAIRRGAPAIGIPLLVLVLFGAAELRRANTFRTDAPVGTVIESDVKLRDRVSPLEGLGAWPDSNFLAGTTGPDAWPVFGLLGVAALAVAVPWWLRRRELAVPLAVLGVAVVYLGTLLAAGLYVQSKALAVPASLVMLLMVRPLLSPRDQPGTGTSSSRTPPRSRRARSWLSPARVALAVAFVAVAAYSSFVALRDAVVASGEHADELSEVREMVAGEWTLSLTTDRFTDYQLRTTRVGSPTRNAQVVFPSRNGKDFRLPLDFDSVPPETLDVVDWVLVTGAPYRSQPRPNLELVEETDSYQLWRRLGPSALNQRVFGEEARPGKVLSCTAEDIAVGGKRRNAVDATILDPPPVIGKRMEWDPSNSLGPGESASQVLELPPGDWQLSLQYQSPLVGLTVEAGGQSFELPAAMDGAIPFRLGEGPFWPVGGFSSEGGPVEVTVRVDERSLVQKLLGVGRQAAIGNMVATRSDPYRTVPFEQACDRYVDSYTIKPGAVKPEAVAKERRRAERALTGRFRPKTPEELAERRRERDAGAG